MSARSQLGSEPIPGGVPVGQPLSGDDDFDALRAEVTRDPVQGVPTDWKVVADLSQLLLAERSKDFTVACYLAVGLLQTEGLVGLRDGLQVLSDLTRTFWDDAFPVVPKRARGRINALGFLSEKSGPILAEIEPKLEDAECVSDCDRLLEEIEKLTAERVEDLEIPLGDLVRALRDLDSRLPRPAEPAAPAEPAPAGQDVPAATGTPSGSSGSFAAGEIRSRSDVESLLFRITTFLKQNDPQNPLAYRLPRIVDFSDLSSEPPNQDGTLMIPGPEAMAMSGMRSLYAASDWLGLVEAADNVCRSSPLSLDAHRFCCEALAALGGPHQAAADGIRDEVKSLLKRVPRLARLRFADGEPLADAETLEWLQEDAAGPAPTGGAATSEVEPEELEAARTEAKELARKGDLPAALARLESTLAADSSPRGRFLGRLELADLCANTGHDRVAIPMLAELDDALQRHELEAWEPALSRRVLELLYLCRKRRAAGDVPDAEAEKALARAEKLYDRLCRIDPIAAAALE